MSAYKWFTNTKTGLHLNQLVVAIQPSLRAAGA